MRAELRGRLAPGAPELARRRKGLSRINLFAATGRNRYVRALPRPHLPSM
jgi:hypothetical protein